MSDQTLRLLPKAAGAYVLAIALRQPVTPTQHQFANQCLLPGQYFYCGSARGPGGIAARVKRHCAPDKKRHWHVDALTTLPAGQVTAALAVIGGDECLLRAMLSDEFGLVAAIAGFGSSDCRDCPAHLLTMPEEHLCGANILKMLAGMVGSQA
ncbi:hypothetical protein LF95_02645 [Thalassospira sp. TSL5-1]|nr:hypothetical protein LF95_02645 [Thalassospira sp. TSL5-1]